MVYCTLFNKNYIDRGIVMINSLLAVDDEAKIYILCMDNVTKQIIEKEYNGQVICIELSIIEDNDLLRCKNNRSQGEYCWTCTAKLLYYILNVYKEATCTYVDADMRFYSDPRCLLREMKENGCEIQAIAHNFPMTWKGKQEAEENGRLCVQFNTFSNDVKSMKILLKWAEQCIIECTVDSHGDQKYTDSWCENGAVNVSKNLGAGIAPWNVGRFVMKNWSEHIVWDKQTREDYKMVFYHFQSAIVQNGGKELGYVTPLLRYWNVDKELVDHLYKEYYTEIMLIRRRLKKYYIYTDANDNNKADERRPRIQKNLSVFLNMSLREKIDFLGMIIRKRIRRKKIWRTLEAE